MQADVDRVEGRTKVVMMKEDPGKRKYVCVRGEPREMKRREKTRGPEGKKAQGEKSVRAGRVVSDAAANNPLMRGRGAPAPEDLPARAQLG